MNLLSAKVKHKIFGIGEIIEVKDEFVTVAFSSKTTKIAYPSAFASFIRAIDDNLIGTKSINVRRKYVSSWY